MAPFIAETFNFSPAQKGLMLFIPIMAGALMRFPLGLLSQYGCRKKATLVEMGLTMVAMLLVAPSLAQAFDQNPAFQRS